MILRKCHVSRFAPASLLLAALLFGGCDDGSGSGAERSAPAAEGIPVIGVLLYRADDAYVSMVNAAMGKQLEGRAEVLVEAAGNNQITQNEQIQSMLERRVSALAVNLVNTQAASDVLDRLKKAGTPVVFFNREPDLNAVKSYSKARFVGTVPQDAGKMQGDIITALWDAHPEYDRNGDGVVSYIMFQGEPDNPEALARTEYSVRQARERGLTMRQIGETNVCQWDEAMAGQAMELALRRYEDEIELVIANNDSMALGAISALEARGWNSGTGRFLPVVGVDAIPRAVEAIRQGRMSGTVRQDGEGMASAVAALVLNAARGKDFLEGTAYALDESGVAVRIPYTPYTGED